MFKEEDWIAKRVSEAQEAHPSVADTTVDRMKELLKGNLCERIFRQTELADFAKALISDIATPKAEAKNED